MRKFNAIIPFLARYRIAIFLMVTTIFTLLFASNTFIVENIFTYGWYPIWVKGIPLLTAYLPFSIGDIFYTVVLLYVMGHSIKLLNKARKIHPAAVILKKALYRLFMFLLTTYLIFLWVWGLHYFRPQISSRFQLNEKSYNLGELVRLNETLIAELQNNRSSHQQNWDEINHVIRKAYHSAKIISLQESKRLWVKKSLFSKGIAYLGISGYYNPFTGEAQMDEEYPKTLKSFVAAHEIAHQLGFAREDDANFLAFYASEHSKDSALLYSTRVQMFIYANRALYDCDSSKAREFQKKLPLEARGDIKALYEYYESKKNPIEPWVTKFYGLFMKSHKQPQGIVTYREVLSLVMDYYRKHKWGIR